MLVFERVFASTCLTITAQYRLWLPSAAGRFPDTTTEPPVNYGDRTQVTQIKEGIDDDFTLGDLTINFDFGQMSLTSVTSYTDRQVLVSRDASQLTGSVTFDLENAYTTEGAISADVRMNSNLRDATDLQAWSQELRLASNDADATRSFFRDVLGLASERPQQLRDDENAE